MLDNVVRIGHHSISSKYKRYAKTSFVTLMFSVELFSMQRMHCDVGDLLQNRTQLFWSVRHEKPVAVHPSDGAAVVHSCCQFRT